MQKKIGILTWHNHGNFGGSLQAFALFSFLGKRGYNVKIINYDKFADRNSDSKIKRILKIIIGNIVGFFDYRYQSAFSFPFRRFEWKYLNETPLATNKAEVENLVTDFEYLICGSDQIWAPNVFDSIYMLDFQLDKKAKKIAYAPSIGLNEIPQNTAEQYKKLLSDFSAISIREVRGQDILNRQCDITSTVVLDPTLLLDNYDYMQLEKKVYGLRKPFVFCYFLNEHHEYKRSVLSAIKGKDMNVVGVSKKADDSSWMNILKYISPREFLWLIHHASYVFTDSYHRTIFSLLYHKDFYTFRRFTEKDKINQNSRLEQLNAWFNITDRIIDSSDIPSLANCYDFSYFESALNKARDISITYLLEAIK